MNKVFLNHITSQKRILRERVLRGAAVGALLFLMVLAGCTQGTTGIFADIEQEVEIKTSNLVDDTFAGSIARADTGDGSGERYFAVVGLKLFARSVNDNNWSGVGSPGGHPVTQYVAAIVDSSGDDELYGVFRRDEQDSYGLFRLSSSGSWDPVFNLDDHTGRNLKSITGIAGIDESGNGGKANRLIATMADGSGKRYLVVDPQKTTPVFHEFAGSNGGDIGFRRPVGKALIADSKLWLFLRNTLWVLETSSVGDSSGGTIPDLQNVVVPRNPGSVDYVPTADRLVLVTLDGDVYRSPELSGATPTGWEAAEWVRLGGQSRTFSDVLWVPGAERFLISTITDPVRGTIRRGYYHAVPDSDFSSLSFSEPGGNYRSTELSSAGISQMVRLPGENETLVFALTENNGLWATSSYLTGDVNPDWRWE